MIPGIGQTSKLLGCTRQVLLTGSGQQFIPGGMQCWGIAMRVDATEITTVTENKNGSPNVVTNYSWESVTTLLAGDFIMLETPITDLTLTNATDSIWCYCEDFSGSVITPIVESAVIPANASTHVVVTLSDALNSNSTPATSAFAVSGKTVSSVSIAGAVVTIVVSSGFSHGDTATVNYTKPTSPTANKLRDLNTTGEVATFTGQVVTNNL